MGDAVFIEDRRLNGFDEIILEDSLPLLADDTGRVAGAVRTWHLAKI
jgi:hypothetical protein